MEIHFFLWGNMDFFIHLAFDYYSLAFLTFILLISEVVFFYSIFYMGEDLGIVRFSVMVFLFVGSMLFIVMSPSLLGFIFG